MAVHMKTGDLGNQLLLSSSLELHSDACNISKSNCGAFSAALAGNGGIVSYFHSFLGDIQ